MPAETTTASTLLRPLLRLEDIWIENWPLPRGKYLVTRLVRALHRRGIIRSFWIEYDGLQYLVDPRDYVTRSFIFGEFFEKNVLAGILQSLTPGGVFLDIGANVGLFSIAAARHVGPNGRVIAVEPGPAQRAMLLAHAERNGIGNIEIIDKGFSDQAGSVSLFLSPDSNQGRNSLSAKNALSNRHITIEVGRGDDLLGPTVERLDLVKIDVEGAEMLVLRGLGRTLERLRPVVIIELIPAQLKNFSTSKEEVLSFLAALGYTQQTRLDAANMLLRAR
jgi:FkbM family methyltransferase